MKEKQPEILQGESLAYAIQGEKKKNPNQVAFTITSAKGASIRTDRWRYNRWGEEANIVNEELYDHENDPEEHVNLVDNPKYKTKLKEVRMLFEKKREFARNGLSKL
jgi:arylsulfatase A-like enzyme